MPPLASVYLDPAYKHYPLFKLIFHQMNLYMVLTEELFLKNYQIVRSKNVNIAFYYLLTDPSDERLNELRLKIVDHVPIYFDKQKDSKTGLYSMFESKMLNFHVVDAVSLLNALVFPRVLFADPTFVNAPLKATYNTDTYARESLGFRGDVAVREYRRELKKRGHLEPVSDSEVTDTSIFTSPLLTLPLINRLSPSSAGSDASDDTSRPYLSPEQVQSAVSQTHTLTRHILAMGGFSGSALSDAWFYPELYCNCDSKSSALEVSVWNTYSRCYEVYDITHNAQQYTLLTQLVAHTKTLLAHKVVSNTAVPALSLLNSFGLLLAMTSAQWHNNMKPTETDILVACDISSAKYKGAVDHGVPVVSDAFLWLCVRSGCYNDIEPVAGVNGKPVTVETKESKYDDDNIVDTNRVALGKKPTPKKPRKGGDDESSPTEVVTSEDVSTVTVCTFSLGSDKKKAVKAELCLPSLSSVVSECSFLNYLAGLIVCSSGLSDGDYRHLKRLVTRHNGVLEDSLTSECKLLVCNSMRGDKYDHCVKRGIPIVAWNWVLDFEKTKGLTIVPRYFSRYKHVPVVEDAKATSDAVVVKDKDVPVAPIETSDAVDLSGLRSTSLIRTATATALPLASRLAPHNDTTILNSHAAIGDGVFKKPTTQISSMFKDAQSSQQGAVAVDMKKSMEHTLSCMMYYASNHSANVDPHRTDDVKQLHNILRNRTVPPASIDSLPTAAKQEDNGSSNSNIAPPTLVRVPSILRVNNIKTLDNALSSVVIQKLTRVASQVVERVIPFNDVDDEVDELKKKRPRDSDFPANQTDEEKGIKFKKSKLDEGEGKTESLLKEEDDYIPPPRVNLKRCNSKMQHFESIYYLPLDMGLGPHTTVTPNVSSAPSLSLFTLANNIGTFATASEVIWLQGLGYLGSAIEAPESLQTPEVCRFLTEGWVYIDRDGDSTLNTHLSRDLGRLNKKDKTASPGRGNLPRSPSLSLNQAVELGSSMMANLWHGVEIKSNELSESDLSIYLQPNNSSSADLEPLFSDGVIRNVPTNNTANSSNFSLKSLQNFPNQNSKSGASFDKSSKPQQNLNNMPHLDMNSVNHNFSLYEVVEQTTLDDNLRNMSGEDSYKQLFDDFVEKSMMNDDANPANNEKMLTVQGDNIMFNVDLTSGNNTMLITKKWPAYYDYDILPLTWGQKCDILLALTRFRVWIRRCKELSLNPLTGLPSDAPNFTFTPFETSANVTAIDIPSPKCVFFEERLSSNLFQGLSVLITHGFTPLSLRLLISLCRRHGVYRSTKYRAQNNIGVFITPSLTHMQAWVASLLMHGEGEIAEVTGRYTADEAVQRYLSSIKLTQQDSNSFNKNQVSITAFVVEICEYICNIHTVVTPDWLIMSVIKQTELDPTPYSVVASRKKDTAGGHISFDSKTDVTSVGTPLSTRLMSRLNQINGLDESTEEEEQTTPTNEELIENMKMSFMDKLGVMLHTDNNQVSTPVPKTSHKHPGDDDEDYNYNINTGGEVEFDFGDEFPMFDDEFGLNEEAPVSNAVKNTVDSQVTPSKKPQPDEELDFDIAAVDGSSKHDLAQSTLNNNRFPIRTVGEFALEPIDMSLPMVDRYAVDDLVEKTSVVKPDLVRTATKDDDTYMSPFDKGAIVYELSPLSIQAMQDSVKKPVESSPVAAEAPKKSKASNENKNKSSTAIESAVGSSSSSSASVVGTGRLFENVVFAVCLSDLQQTILITDIITSNGGVIAPNNTAKDVLSGGVAFKSKFNSTSNPYSSTNGHALSDIPSGLLPSSYFTSSIQHPSVTLTGVHIVITDGFSSEFKEWFSLAPVECGGGVGAPEAETGEWMDLYGDGHADTLIPNIDNNTTNANFSNINLFSGTAVETEEAVMSVLTSTNTQYLLSSTNNSAFHTYFKQEAKNANNQRLYYSMYRLANAWFEKEKEHFIRITPSLLKHHIRRFISQNQGQPGFFPAYVKSSSTPPLPLCILKPSWVQSCAASKKFLDPRRQYLHQSYIDIRSLFVEMYFDICPTQIQGSKRIFKRSQKNHNRNSMIECLETSDLNKTFVFPSLKSILCSSLYHRIVNSEIVKKSYSYFKDVVFAYNDYITSLRTNKVKTSQILVKLEDIPDVYKYIIENNIVKSPTSAADNHDQTDSSVMSLKARYISLLFSDAATESRSVYLAGTATVYSEHHFIKLIPGVYLKTIGNLGILVVDSTTHQDHVKVPLSLIQTASTMCEPPGILCSTQKSFNIEGNASTALLSFSPLSIKTRDVVHSSYPRMIPFYMPLPSLPWYRIPFSTDYLNRKYSSGVIVCSSGIHSTDRDALADLLANISSLGKKAFTNELNRKVTHLICHSSNTPKFARAQEWGIHIVHPNWLVESARAGAPLMESFFPYK